MLLASGSGPGLQIDFDFTGELSKSCKSKIPGGISLLLWSFGKLIIPINIWVITIPCDQRGGGWGEFPFLWPLYRPLLSGKRFLNLLSLNALQVCMPQRPQNSPVTFYFFPAAWPSSQAGGAGRNRPFSSSPPQSPPKGRSSRGAGTPGAQRTEVSSLPAPSKRKWGRAHGRGWRTTPEKVS